MSPRHVAAMDIGGTHVTAALVDVTTWGVVEGSLCRRPIDGQAPADVLVGSFVDTATCAGADLGTPWGVAIPGPFDYALGVGLFEGVGKFDSLRGLNLGTVLGRAGLDPCAGIHFLNDAAAFALGEWVAGAARGHGRVIGTTLGTGVGSAFLSAGAAVQHGPGVPPEGRLDLLQIGGRPLEDTVSRAAIRARYTSSAGAPRDCAPDVRDIAELARSGDVHALSAIGHPLESLGQVLAPRASAFRANVVVIGGSISSAWDVVQGPLRAGMDRAAPDWSRSCQLVAAQRPHDAALIGAAWSASRATRE